MPLVHSESRESHREIEVIVIASSSRCAVRFRFVHADKPKTQSHQVCGHKSLYLSRYIALQLKRERAPRVFLKNSKETVSLNHVSSRSQFW